MQRSSYVVTTITQPHRPHMHRSDGHSCPSARSRRSVRSAQATDGHALMCIALAESNNNRIILMQRDNNHLNPWHLTCTVATGTHSCPSTRSRRPDRGDRAGVSAQATDAPRLMPLVLHAGRKFVTSFQEGKQVADLFAGQHIQQAFGHRRSSRQNFVFDIPFTNRGDGARCQ